LPNYNFFTLLTAKGLFYMFIQNHYHYLPLSPYIVIIYLKQITQLVLPQMFIAQILSNIKKCIRYLSFNDLIH